MPATRDSGPWERIHLDFAEVKKEMFLVVMDAYSGWPEIIHMQTTTARKTIEAFRNLFAAYGLPKEVVSDNGPQFTWLKDWSKTLKGL
jgi:transposase InsO family protein